MLRRAGAAAAAVDVTVARQNNNASMRFVHLLRNGHYSYGSAKSAEPSFGVSNQPAQGAKTVNSLFDSLIYSYFLFCRWACKEKGLGLLTLGPGQGQAAATRARLDSRMPLSWF